MKIMIKEQPGAQGELYFEWVDGELPATAKEVAAVNGALIVGHSESGHMHSIVLEREADEPNAVLYQDENPLIAWLKVNRPVVLEHHRDFDTHEAWQFNPGLIRFDRQREGHSPEVFRAVQD